MSEPRRTPGKPSTAQSGTRFDAPLKGYRPSLLVVTAWQQLRERCEESFDAAGYQIFTTDLGRSAIAFLRETADPPDLVVCDTDLRDVRAVDVADQAYRRGARVIPISSEKIAERSQSHDSGCDAQMLVERVMSILPPSYGERPRP